MSGLSNEQQIWLVYTGARMHEWIGAKLAASSALYVYLHNQGQLANSKKPTIALHNELQLKQ